jgi:transcriptional repressor of cell division inhibition gene dicB
VKIKTKDAVEYFKGVAELAAALRISRAAIYQWGEFVPEGRAYQIHLLSNMTLPAQADADDAVQPTGAAA